MTTRNFPASDEENKAAASLGHWSQMVTCKGIPHEQAEHERFNS